MTMNTIPAMTPECVHEYLYRLGRQWTGQGAAVELGSWLGASAVPLLRGLKDAGYNKTFYAYDRWRANEAEVEKAMAQGLKIKPAQDLLPIFLENTHAVYGDIKAFKGGIIENLRWKDEKIEICIFDAPKRNPTFRHAVHELSPYWIPGVTVLGLLDYYFYRDCEGKKKEACLVQTKFIEYNKGRFTMLAHWPDECQCAFFRYNGGSLTIPK